MKTTTIRIAAIATTAVLSLGGAFWAGSSSADTQTKTVTKTVTKKDPIQNCLTGALKKYGTTDEVIDECKSLTDMERNQANAVIEGFVNALFSQSEFEEALAS